MQCEGIIAERTVPVGSEVVEVVPARYEEQDGEPVMVEPAVTERRIITETTQEHRCEADATMLARSQKQERCSLGELHWVKDGPDRVYCPPCFLPGTVTHASGQTNLHPAMSIDDYEGA